MSNDSEPLDDKPLKGTRKSQYHDALRGLQPREKVFVRGILEGLSPVDAYSRLPYIKGQLNDEGAGYYLSKPHIRQAIEAGLLRVFDPRLAYQILSFLAIHHAMNVMAQGSNQEKITIIRDIWDRAGYGAIHKSETKRVDLKDVLKEIKERRSLKLLPPTEKAG